jgi:hypothetical protein
MVVKNEIKVLLDGVPVAWQSYKTTINIAAYPILGHREKHREDPGVRL